MERFHSGVSELGARLREAREAASVTQTSLAEAAGISRPAVSQFESGLKRPELETVERLAFALDVRAGWLAFGEAPRGR